MTKKILIVCAHADDEVLGMGGTIAKLAQDNHEIAVQFLADGEASRDNSSDISTKIRGRESDARRAADILGAHHLSFENFPDNKMDSVALLDIVKAVEKKITEFQPDIIYTHYAHDLNIDHRITFQAVMTACRPIQGNHFPKEIFSFEVNSSSEWASEERFNPNVFIDISNSIDKKLNALKCYDKEMRDFPHPRSYEAVKALAKLRGSECALQAAEAFMCIRAIR